jgi:amino acid transporter
MSKDELRALEIVGHHWDAALGGRQWDAASLPCDPDLNEALAPSAPLSRYERLSPYASFRYRGEGELEATRGAGRERSRLARMLGRTRRLIFGPPLATTALVEERLSKPVALAVLSSDALSSVAYATEAMLGVLILAGSTALDRAIPIGVAIIALMLLVGLSYRQTIRAYPKGGGSYIVASDNLGRLPGLMAGAGLIVDYILTVAVSVAAGVAAVTSAVPELRPYPVELGLVLIGLVLALNLRGLRQAGTTFAVPTYVFVVSMLVLIGTGLGRAAADGFHVAPAPSNAATQSLGVFLILRAFASGCSAMTGVEAISDGVPAFRPPEWRNARTTLAWMIGLLAVMFAGITYLAHQRGLAPGGDETILSRLASGIFGRGAMYVVIQTATVLILVLAANTAFNDFPRLLFFMARDGFAPRAFLRLGDRLAFTNGILVLGAAAALLLAAFGGSTDSLIHLYAVGVFLSFTLSQSGMVARWWRRREPGWRLGICFNAAGAAATAVVLLVVGLTKFLEGAWVVVIILPGIVLGALAIRRHYDTAARALALRPLDPDPEAQGGPLTHPPVPRLTPVPSEEAESPQELAHLIVVPVGRLHRATMRTLAYASSLGYPTLALHVAPDDEGARRMRAYWSIWGEHLPLETLVAPYRAVVATIANYLSALHRQQPELTLTVVVPELLPAKGWQRLLHNGTERRLRAALHDHYGAVLVSVPFHLPER